MDKLSVIIPTLNEEGNIRALTERLHKTLSPKLTAWELIFIDDHSTDETRREIRRQSALYPVSLYLKEGKRGKAFSLLEGFAKAKYDTIAMIDADLQYPPEALSEMADRIREGADIVVANRKEQHIGYLRKFVSKTFLFFFVYLLHGFSFDSQGGLKIFRKKILREVALHPTPWTFDLEFLVKSKDAGYKIEHVDIIFENRVSGVSKINVLNAAFEIGLGALKLWLRKRTPAPVPPDKPGSMIGAGLSFKGRRFITHSTLEHERSALKTFQASQKFFIAAVGLVLALGFFYYPLKTGIALAALLSVFYFLDVFFNFYLVGRSLYSPPEIFSSPKEIRELDDKTLPVYTILSPLYRETAVLPYFIQAIEKINWPKEKLDVILLLEEDDLETVGAVRRMGLPSYIRPLIVPHSLPKTKPKACNYGLAHARGEYLVIYDAEDIPEPDQLKKAYLGFNRVGDGVKCLQAKLNYYNPEQNILTRLFTAEYSQWFELILPGLQALSAPIPLGGTSNHFRVKDLKTLKGWDAFNVTEDADLGMRLSKMGFQTAIIDSVTLEEANSRVGNWYRQRSRWIKGYLQTYLVHMRRPGTFPRGFFDRRFWIFQLNIGGKSFSTFINPLMWIITFSYFAFRAELGPAIEAFYPTPVLIMGVFSLVFGNFFYLYNYMVALAKRSDEGLIKYALLVPFYWLFMSAAAWKALFQLFLKPHFWEKTVHGLAGEKASEIPSPARPEKVPRKIPAPASLLASAYASPAAVFPASPGIARITDVLVKSPSDVKTPSVSAARSRPNLKKYLGNLMRAEAFTSGGFLVAALMFANFLNFIFNAFLGRALSLEAFGILTLINTFSYLISIFIGALATTVNHRTSWLVAKRGPAAGVTFLGFVRRYSVFLSAVLVAAWLILVPFLASFFKISSVWVLFSFAPVLSFGLIYAANRGFLQGNLRFVQIALMVLAEASSKILFAAGFVLFGFSSLAVLSIPLSLTVAFLLSWYLASRLRKAVSGLEEVRVLSPAVTGFPRRFFFFSLLTGFSSAAFLSLDVILAKHYLSPSLAGEYSLLSLVGKMIYFFGSLLSVFIVTFVSRREGEGKNPHPIFYRLFAGITVLTALAFTGLGVFGRFFVPVLLGEKSLAILPYLAPYAFAISLFTLTHAIVIFHLSRRHYLFSAFSIFTAGLMALGIAFLHDSILSIVRILSAVSMFAMAGVLILHFLQRNGRFLIANLVDLLDVFYPLPKAALPQAGKKRILIFNWRDTKHTFAGGAEVYVHELAKRWVKDGNAVTLFCGNDGKSSREEVVDGINVIRRGGFYFVYFWAFLYYIFKFRGRFDVIVDCQNGIPFFTPLYAKEKVLCVLHHVHQEIFRKYLPAPLALFASFLENRLQPWAYRDSKYITVSDSSRKDMEKLDLTGLGVDVVHPGVDLSSLRPGEKYEDPIVLYLGRLKAYKSVDVLIRAFRRVWQKIPKAKLVIAGDGEEEGRLRTLTERLGLSEHVLFTGRITEDEKLSLLQKAWVFVNPSAMEGWGITTVEANACGVPVVASDVPGLRDSVRNPHTGYLVKYGDEAAFAEKIQSLLTDERLRGEMSARAVVWARNFDWDKSSELFLEKMESPVSGRRRDQEFQLQYYG